MGSWLTSLINSQRNAEDIRSDPHAIVAYTLLLGLAILVVLLWSVIVILTAIRICRKLSRKPRTIATDGKNVANVQIGMKLLNTSRQNQQSEFEAIELITAAGPSKLRTAVLGFKLRVGHETDRPGIFVDKVKPGSIAEAKLFTGDRILAVNGFHLNNVSLKYALDVIQALRQAEGRLKIYVKRAPLREQRINEAFSMYCDDKDTGKRVVFNEDHMQIFEDAFSLYDQRNSGKIRMKLLFPLLRSLGYNIHQSEAWVYMNELGLADQQGIHFFDFIKLLEKVVADQVSSREIHDAYNVFDWEKKGHVTVDELKDAMERLPGNRKFTEMEIQQVLRLADNDDDGVIQVEGRRKRRSRSRDPHRSVHDE